VTVRVQVYDSRIQEMFNPGGSVHKWTRDLAIRVLDRSMRECPKRTSFLAFSHDFSVGTNHFGTVGYVKNHAEYAVFVHEGTRDVIFPVTNKYLVVRPHPHSHYTRYTSRRWVRGQHANPWMERALVREMASLR
jgi:hypothetical protein